LALGARGPNFSSSRLLAGHFVDHRRNPLLILAHVAAAGILPSQLQAAVDQLLVIVNAVWTAPD
jgi:hypothetical protein